MGKIIYPFEEDEEFKEALNEIKKEDPKIFKYFMFFQKIEENAIKRFMLYNQRFQIEQLMQVQAFIESLAEKIANTKKSSIKEQIKEMKEALPEIFNIFRPMLMGFAYQPSLMSPPQTTTSLPSKIQINITESDEEEEKVKEEKA